MSDDSLSDMPSFDKPENIPLVVPDLTPLRTIRCKDKKADGSPCTMYIRPPHEYCIAHNPNISEEQRQEWRRKGGQHTRDITRVFGHKSAEEMLHILSRRLQDFVENCEASGHATAGEIITIAQACKAWAVLHDRKVEKPDEGKIGWRMKGAV